VTEIFGWPWATQWIFLSESILVTFLKMAIYNVNRCRLKPPFRSDSTQPPDIFKSCGVRLLLPHVFWTIKCSDWDIWTILIATVNVFVRDWWRESGDSNMADIDKLNGQLFVVFTSYLRYLRSLESIPNVLLSIGDLYTALWDLFTS
jgi:hypothetical protein